MSYRYPLAMRLPVPIGYEAEGAPELVWTLWSRQKPLAAFQLVDRHYTGSPQTASLATGICLGNTARAMVRPPHRNNVNMCSCYEVIILVCTSWRPRWHSTEPDRISLHTLTYTSESEAIYDECWLSSNARWCYLWQQVSLQMNTHVRSATAHTL
jgi:hypothetical protein